MNSVCMHVCTYLTDVTDGILIRRRFEEGEALVFTGELVSMVNAVVTAVAKGSFIGSTIHRCFIFITHITLDLHLLLFS